ncbi:MAG: alpha-E domain-containing protein [Rhodospirillaceae bacterium]
MNNLLARYAEDIFWMARYMERTENLARILDVHETYGHDHHGSKNWRSIIRLNGDEKGFFDRYPTASAENVVYFYILDDSNPTSIVSGIRAARENARCLRPWISTEMWTHINVFHNRLLSLTPEDIALPALTRLCSMIKESCQTHSGITEGTFYRDEGWYFYLLGKNVERADQTTRLLDIGFHAPGPSADAIDPARHDFVHWHAVLRSVAGYHAFRRVYPHGMTPADIAVFILYNESFPRSVTLCVREINLLLTRLKSRYKLNGGNKALERIDEIQSALATRAIERVIRDGLHGHLDWLQLRLSDFTSELSRSFFGRQPSEVSQQQEA